MTRFRPFSAASPSRILEISPAYRVARQERTLRGRTHNPVSCQKGKPIRKAKPGDFCCKECGFVSAKKKKLCEPKKVKK